ncbi:MAG: hypothetical protein ACI3XQ_13425 [Eubacteriales bacterium]
MINNYLTFAEYINMGGALPPLLESSQEVISPTGSALLTVISLLRAVYDEAYIPIIADAGDDVTSTDNIFYRRLERACTLFDYAHAQAEDIKRMRASVARGTYTETSGDVTAIRPNDGAINPVNGYVDGDTRTNTISTVESDTLDRYTGIDIFAPMYRPYIDLFRPCFINTRVLGVC